MSHIIGIGANITECLRIARMIERHGELFMDRVYSPDEIRYCQDRKQATQHFTGYWAAKEAVLKALGVGWQRGIAWTDIEIATSPGARTVARLHGGVREISEQLGVARLLVAISHCRTHATAYAIAIGGEPGDGA